MVLATSGMESRWWEKAVQKWFGDPYLESLPSYSHSEWLEIALERPKTLMSFSYVPVSTGMRDSLISPTNIRAPGRVAGSKAQSLVPDGVDISVGEPERLRAGHTCDSDCFRPGPDGWISGGGRLN